MASYVSLPIGVETYSIIESKALAAAATYTSPSWPAGAYSKIVIRFVGSVSAFSYFRLQANADPTAVYTDIGTNANTSIGIDSAFKGTNGFARVGVAINPGPTTCVNVVEFYPVTTGQTRPGLFTCMSDGNSATGANSMSRQGGFSYNDTATDITFVTYSVTAATMTGKILVLGVPA